MMYEQYPMLTELYARGSAAFEGMPLASLLIEVRGGQLFITGTTSLRDDGEHYIETGAEYCYILESAEAEKLLAALSRRSKDRPEKVIAEEFEFSRPDCRLKDYLDEEGIACRYEWSPGEPI